MAVHLDMICVHCFSPLSRQLGVSQHSTLCYGFNTPHRTVRAVFPHTAPQ